MSLYGVHDYCLPAWVKEGSRLFLYHLLTFWVQRARVALRPTLINNLWPAVRPRDFTKFTEDDRLRVAEELFGSWGAVSSGTRLRYATSTDVTAPDCDVKTLTAELERYQCARRTKHAAETTAESHWLDQAGYSEAERSELSTWLDLLNPVKRGGIVDEHDALLCAEFQRTQEHVNTEFASQVAQVFSNCMIRRSHQSLGHSGFPLTAIQPIEVEIVWITMDSTQREMYDRLNAEHPDKDNRFYTTTQCALKSLTSTLTGHVNYNARPSCALLALADTLNAWELEQRDRSLEEREKLVIFSEWTSLFGDFQLQLAKRGHYTSSLHGGHDPETRAAIIREFQRPGPHMSDP